MAIATIKIEFLPGDDIESAFTEAIRIAKILNVWVQFKFNAVECLARESSSVETGVKAYFDILKIDTNHKFIMA